jgi:hypothetical protein
MTARHCLMDDHCDKGSQRKITTKQNTETGTPSPFQTMLTTAVYISIGNQITVSHAIGRVLCLYLCLYSAGFSIPKAAAGFSIPKSSAGFVTVLVWRKIPTSPQRQDRSYTQLFRSQRWLGWSLLVCSSLLPVSGALLSSSSPRLSTSMAP